LKIRIRITWFVLAVLLLSSVSMVAFRIYQSYQELQDLQVIYRKNELQTTRAILSTINTSLQNNDWNEITWNITQTQESSGAIRIAILKRDGAVLADSYSGNTLRPIDVNLVDTAARFGEAVLWEPGKDILELALPIEVSNSHDAAILVRETDLTQEFASVRTNLNGNLTASSVIGSLLVLLILWGVWQAVIRPLFQIRSVAEGISRGETTLRVSATWVRELDDLGLSFNQMLNQLDSQRAALENANRNLEQVVADRTAQLSQRAASLETLNHIIHTASLSENLKDLVELALQQIIALTHADFGWLRIGSASASHNVSREMGKLFKEIGSYQPDFFGPEIVVEDWDSPLLKPSLNGMAVKMKPYGIRQTVSLPISAGGESIGRLELSSKDSSLWETQNVFLKIIGKQLGDAAERMRSFQKSLETSRWMTRLVAQSELLNQSYTFEEVVQAIGVGALTLSEARYGAFFLRIENKVLCSWRQGISNDLAQFLASGVEQKNRALLPDNNWRLFVANIADLDEANAEWWRVHGEGIQAYGVWPLIYEHQISAYVFCLYDETMDSRHIGLEAMDAFVRQAAGALENARLFKAEKEQSKLANALRDVAAALTSTLDLNEVFERILSNLGKVIEHDSANVMMLDGDGVQIMRSQGYSHTQELENWRNPLKHFKILEQVRATGQAIAVSDTYQDPRWVPLPESDWVRSYACAPIRSWGEVIGFVNVHSRTAGFFDLSHAAILQVFADQASIAIENARQYGSAHQKMTETGTLFRALTPLLDAGGNIETVTENLVDTLVREFSLSYCGVFLLDQERRALRLVKEGGETQTSSDVMPLDGPGLVVAAVNSSTMIYVPDVQMDPRYEKYVVSTQSEFDIPLIASNEVLGVLNLESPQLDAFSPQMRRILASFAERAGWVVENALLFGAAQTSARQMTLLNEITQVSLQNDVISHILDVIAQKVAELLDADGCYITGWVDETHTSVPIAAWGVDADSFMALHLPNGEYSLTTAVIHAGQPIAVESVATSKEINPLTAEILSVESLLGVPLIADGQKMGAILIGVSQKHLFRKVEISLAEQAAGQIALVISRRNSLDLARRRAEESERLRQATAALTVTLDVHEVCELIISNIRTLVDLDSVIVYLIDNGKVKPVAFENIPMGKDLLDLEFQLTDSVYLEAQQTGLPIALLDAQAEPRFKNWGDTKSVRSFLGVPLLSESRLLGGISVGRFEIRPFQADEILLARVFSNQAAVAIQNALLHSREQQLAITDPLTGLYNRRGFFELARHEVERMRRFNRPLSAMMIDVDHFKNVNDRYGHPVGDVVLFELAQRLRKEMREADLLCRYGGEEFLVLLPESDAEGAVGAAERILSVIRHEPICTGEHAVAITVSIGVAVLYLAGRSLDELILDADNALLVAKSLGRDRLSVWENNPSI
jgi:diguanylate cyclase (GGDEF)-like protein